MKLTKAQRADMRAALNELFDAVGNKAEISRACGIGTQGVNGWKLRGYPPTAHVETLVELAALKGKAIPSHRFRPDAFRSPDAGPRIQPEKIAAKRARA